MLGAPCSPCCSNSCGDNKPVTDPADEGTWVASGTPVDGLTWTFQPRAAGGVGNTWFFYGSAATSKNGGSATLAEQQEWGNLCNWYSARTVSPDRTDTQNNLVIPSMGARASRLPPASATVHIYTPVSTANVGEVTVEKAYFWASAIFMQGTLTTTSTVTGSSFGSLFNNKTQNLGTINGGATFPSYDFFSVNNGTINGGALFAGNAWQYGTVNGNARFQIFSIQGGVVNGAAIFTGQARNSGTVNNGAQFNDSSYNTQTGTVNGGATFNDAACSLRGRFAGGVLYYVAHPVDFPVCNGTAPQGRTNNQTCGCN